MLLRTLNLHSFIHILTRPSISSLRPRLPHPPLLPLPPTPSPKKKESAQNNSPLPQPQHHIPQRPLRRKARNLPPTRLAVVFRPVARPQRIPHHVLARRRGVDLRAVGQAAHDGHAREAGAGGRAEGAGGGEEGGAEEGGGAEGG